MAELTCDVVHSLIPELALGLLPGRERAEVLAHVEHCAACQHELLLMGDVADRLVELTPRAEPPAGFEASVLAAVQTSQPQSQPLPSPAHLRQPDTGKDRPRGPGRTHAGRRWRPVGAGLAAAVVTASVGVGGWALGHHGARTTPPAVASAQGKAVVAELLHDQRPVGQVVFTDDPYPWMWVAVSSLTGDARVTCEVGEKNGKWTRLASFHLTQGAGYWAAPMPQISSPIIGARVVDDAGHTLATASISTSI